MPVGIAGANVIGVARETTNGTYLAPEKFLHIRSENLHVVDEPVLRRPLIGVVDVAGIVHGWSHVEGDIELEVYHEELPYLMYGMRGNIVKTGAGPYVYTMTPQHTGVQTGTKKTLSFTIERNGAVFGYTGCVVSRIAFSLDEGTLIATCTIMGLDEATQAAPTETYETTRPFEAGEYLVEIPTATPVLDTDDLEIVIDDGAEAVHRLIDGQRSPAFIKWGERSVNVNFERDFIDKTEYSAFRAQSSSTVHVRAEQSATLYVDFVLHAGVRNTYEVGTDGGQADLVRATAEWIGTYSQAQSAVYTLVCGTDENLA